MIFGINNNTSNNTANNSNVSSAKKQESGALDYLNMIKEFQNAGTAPQKIASIGKIIAAIMAG